MIKMSLLKRREVLDALKIQKQRGGPRGAILVEAGLIPEQQLNLALAAQVGMETLDLATLAIAQEVIDIVSAQMADT